MDTRDHGIYLTLNVTMATVTHHQKARLPQARNTVTVISNSTTINAHHHHQLRYRAVGEVGVSIFTRTRRTVYSRERRATQRARYIQSSIAVRKVSEMITYMTTPMI